MKLLLPFFLPVILAAATASAETVIGRFSSGSLDRWEEKVFHGRTDYRLVQDSGRTVLQARSSAAASGLFQKVDIDPKKTPRLRWSWKIARTLPREDARKKSGDDYAARVYVVFRRTFFWQTRGIAYIWSANLPKETRLPNAYTGNVMMVAVESGDGKAGQWVEEERNLLEDYRRLFGEEPAGIGAVAVMTDTDDTGSEATAWYGDITLSSR